MSMRSCLPYPRYKLSGFVWICSGCAALAETATVSHLDRCALLPVCPLGTGDSEQSGPKKKVVYARKKPSKKPSDTAAAEAAAEAEAEEARQAEVNISSQMHSAIGQQKQ